MVPLPIRFDGVPNVFGSHTVHMPKLYEGAPYSFGFRIRFEDDSYRNFDTVVEMRWRIKLRPSDSVDLMVLTKSNGNFTVTTEVYPGDTLRFVVKAADWEGVTLPRSPNHMELDVPFSHVVEFLDAEGVVVERFAQGSGLISVDLVP
jgi:hypothetical protein